MNRLEKRLDSVATKILSINPAFFTKEFLINLLAQVVPNDTDNSGNDINTFNDVMFKLNRTRGVKQEMTELLEVMGMGMLDDLIALLKQVKDASKQKELGDDALDHWICEKALYALNIVNIQFKYDCIVAKFAK